ncbi:hypothetical protein [Vreelandella sp. EE27]
MIDAIIHTPDFPALVTTLDASYPNLLERNDDGSISQPPTVTGFARTPAVSNGDEVMIYARLDATEADQWRGIEGVQILAEREFSGKGTADALFDAVRADANTKAIYDRVYPRPVQQFDDGEGGTFEYQRPANFGMIAGA